MSLCLFSICRDVNKFKTSRQISSSGVNSGSLCRMQLLRVLVGGCCISSEEGLEKNREKRDASYPDDTPIDSISFL